MIIQISAPRSIGLPSKEYYKDNEILEKYRSTIQESLGLVPSFRGSDNFNTSRRSLAQDIVHMESLMAAAAPEAEDADDVTVRGLCRIALIQY